MRSRSDFQDLLTLAVLLAAVLGGCQREERQARTPAPPADDKAALTLCGRPFIDAIDATLDKEGPAPAVHMDEQVGSFAIDNMTGKTALTCTFDLLGPHVRPQTVFTRYGAADASRVTIAPTTGGVRVTYPIPAHSYGLISVEPPVRVGEPRRFEEGGLRYDITGGAFLRTEDHEPIFRSLGPATRIDLNNVSSREQRVSFSLKNTSDRLSEPVLTGLIDGRVRRQGSLRLVVTGRLAAAGRAALTLKPRPLPSEWSFVFGGDIKRQLGIFMELLERVRLRSDPLFMLAAGDYTRNSLPQELAAYQDRIAQIPFPIYTIRGNHELRAQGARHYARLFGPDHYSFEVGDVLFAVIDASTYGPAGFVIGDAQFQWLEGLLSHHRQQTWKILALHPPPHPLHGASLRKDYPTNLAPAESQRLRDLAVKYGVAYVLSGHAHLYARGMEVGTVYLTSGGGGATLHQFQKVPGFTIRPIRHLMVFHVGPGEIEEQLVTLPRFEDEDD